MLARAGIYRLVTSDRAAMFKPESVRAAYLAEITVAYDDGHVATYMHLEAGSVTAAGLGAGKRVDLGVLFDEVSSR